MVEIIQSGYCKKDSDLKIGDSYIQEDVVSIWDFPPKNVFVYYSGKGHHRNHHRAYCKKHLEEA